MKRLTLMSLAAAILLATVPCIAAAQEHRAEQTREITYWLLDPATASFRISHDFTADEGGQRYVHNFVRAGSEVSASTFWDLNTGQQLRSYHVTGADVLRQSRAHEFDRPLVSRHFFDPRLSGP